MRKNIKQISLRTSLLTSLLMLFLCIGNNAFAHHSVAVHFVPDRLITVSGVVNKFTFSNPHGVVFFDAVDENGVQATWKAETNSPNILRRRGWSKDVIVPGDEITIEGYPSRDGSPHMRLMKVTYPDGRVLTPGGID